MRSQAEVLHVFLPVCLVSSSYRCGTRLSWDLPNPRRVLLCTVIPNPFILLKAKR